MEGCRSAATVLVLLLVTVPCPQQCAAAADVQQPSAADQLSALLGPAVEAAVSRALDSQRRCEDSAAGQRALNELGRLQGQLNAAVHGLSELQLQFAMMRGQLKVKDAEPAICRPPTQQTEEPESKTVCEKSPQALAAGAGSYSDPEKRACARSCLELRNQGGSPQNGVYWFTGMPVPVLCDFSHDGGGWTLLLAVAAADGWNSLSVLRRNERSPSLNSNYAILSYADTIRDLGTGDRFAYRIEAQAETARRRWGGIWLAPRHYSFVHESPSQTNVSRPAKFDQWEYKDIGIERRMPWINMGSGSAVLTTSTHADNQWYGTLVTHETNPDYRFSPWIHGQVLHSGKVLYWLREEKI